MKRLLAGACAAAVIAVLGGCASSSGEYAYGGGPVGYDGYYDDYYGPFVDGYWGGDGDFYYADGGGHFHHDWGHHFRHTADTGFHAVHGQPHAGAARGH